MRKPTVPEAVEAQQLRLQGISRLVPSHVGRPMSVLKATQTHSKLSYRDRDLSRRCPKPARRVRPGGFHKVERLCRYYIRLSKLPKLLITYVFVNRGWCAAIAQCTLHINTAMARARYQRPIDIKAMSIRKRRALPFRSKLRPRLVFVTTKVKHCWRKGAVTVCVVIELPP